MVDLESTAQFIDAFMESEGLVNIRCSGSKSCSVKGQYLFLYYEGFADVMMFTVSVFVLLNGESVPLMMIVDLVGISTLRLKTDPLAYPAYK